MSLATIMTGHAEAIVDRHVAGDDYVNAVFGNLSVNCLIEDVRRSQKIDEESAGLRVVKSVNIIVKVSQLGEYADTYKIGDRVEIYRVGSTSPDVYDLDEFVISADNSLATITLTQP